MYQKKALRRERARRNKALLFTLLIHLGLLSLLYFSGEGEHVAELAKGWLGGSTLPKP